MLIVAATPIGNLGDATARLVEALRTATLVASEDSRVTARLLAGLGVDNRPRIVVVNEHSERGRIDELLAAAAVGDVLLLSDAGMPTVSDPGFQLVRAAADAGVRVTVLPGASAVLGALAVAGLPTDRFVFEGFAPRKRGERLRWLGVLAAEPRTAVLFESPNRLAAMLADMVTVFGPDRRAVVVRELTKLHEEVRRGTVAELAGWAAEGVRGEIVVVLAGAPTVPVSFEDAVAQVRERIGRGERRKDAAAAVAATCTFGARDLYEATLAKV